MTTYLQRLLDRSAGLPTAAPMGVRPVLHSGSPMLSFDQRLADPSLASDYSLVGAPPEEPAAFDEAPYLPPSAETGRPPFPTPGMQSPLTERKRAAISPASPIMPAPPRENGISSPPPRRSARKEPTPGAGARQASSLRAQPEPPSLSPPSRRVTPSEPVVRAGTVADPGALTATAPPAANPFTPAQPESERGPARRIATATATAAPVRPKAHDTSAASPAPGTRPASPPRPIQAPLPDPDSPTFRPVQTSQPQRIAEPVIAMPEPPPAPPVGTRPQDIERMVREAVRAETARQARVAPKPPTPAPAPVAGEPAKPRPTTAAEASVIGKLEGSTYRATLFGVRRR